MPECASLVRIPRRLDTAASLARNGDLYDAAREIRQIRGEVEWVGRAVQVVREKLLAAQMANSLIKGPQVADRLIGEAFDLLTEISVCVTCRSLDASPKAAE